MRTSIVEASILAAMVVGACGAPSAEIATSAPPRPVSTVTATPVATLTPTPAPTAQPSATPEGQIFRDDFAGVLQPGWTWQNENPDRWTITEDGWLQILAEDSALLQDFAQSNLLWHALPPGDFVVTVHVQSIPLADFHQTAIFIYEDGSNYITINRGYCSLPNCVGTGVYMDYAIGGEWGGYKQHTEATDLYMRLESAGGMISGYYSLDGSDWQRVGRFGNYFTFTRVGIGVSNVDAPPPDDADLLGRYDFFEITRP